MKALEVQGLRRAFGGLVAVNDVSFAVEPGEVVGVIGPNGSGKSTLFNLLTGVLKPDHGSIHLFGTDITRAAIHHIARLGVARTFQIPQLFINMTVRDNLLAATVEGSWHDAPERADAVLELLQLDPVSDQLARGLSGGQQRLLEMGRILMRSPKLVFLDEVAAGVHPKLRVTIMKAIEELRARRVGIFVIEHDMELTQTVCDRMIVMNAGSILAQGSFKEVTSDAAVMEAYLGGGL